MPKSSYNVFTSFGEALLKSILQYFVRTKINLSTLVASFLLFLVYRLADCSYKSNKVLISMSMSVVSN